MEPTITAEAFNNPRAECVHYVYALIFGLGVVMFPGRCNSGVKLMILN